MILQKVFQSTYRIPMIQFNMRNFFHVATTLTVLCPRARTSPQPDREAAVGEGGCSGRGRLQWEREAAVGQGGCSGRGRLQWEREAAVGQGGCSGRGRLQWDREAAVGEGGCSGRGRLQWDREAAVGEGGCSQTGRLQWERELRLQWYWECRSPTSYTRGGLELEELPHGQSTDRRQATLQWARAHSRSPHFALH